MPSSFTQVISNALVFSTCPPVSVSGTVELNLSLSDFSWKLGICFFVTCYSNSYSCLRVNRVPDLPKTPSYTLKLGLPTPSKLSLLRHHFAVKFSTGILTRFPSTTLLSLALGADSPCADERCAGNLGLSACGFFTRIIVTDVSIRASDISSNLLKSPSQTYRTLLYHLNTP